jgi:hypothetical protein
MRDRHLAVRIAPYGYAVGPIRMHLSTMHERRMCQRGPAPGRATILATPITSVGRRVHGGAGPLPDPLAVGRDVGGEHGHPSPKAAGLLILISRMIRHRISPKIAGRPVSRVPGRTSSGKGSR